jgi:hypothetical protein
MDTDILKAIRKGGVEEIVMLFELRASAAQYCKDLELLIIVHPELHYLLEAEQGIIRTIDNYMRNNLQPVCKINDELVFAFPDQCTTLQKMGIAPGNLDLTEQGQKFINPSLPGFVVWGVFDPQLESYEVMPPVAIRHFNVDEVSTLQMLWGVISQD